MTKSFLTANTTTLLLWEDLMYDVLCTIRVLLWKIE